jgi:hypothetical protein
MPLIVFDCKGIPGTPASGLKLLSRLEAGTSKSNTRDGLLPIRFLAECGWSSRGHGLRTGRVFRFGRRSGGYHPAGPGGNHE